MKPEELRAIENSFQTTLDNFRQDAFEPMRTDVRRLADTVVGNQKKLSEHSQRISDTEEEISAIRSNLGKIIIGFVLGAVGWFGKILWTHIKGF